MYRQEETPSYENMSLKEFANQPEVVELHAKYTTHLENIIRNRPYIRIGRILYGEHAILYIDNRRIDDLLNVLGTESLEVFPISLGLLGRASLESSTITQVHQQPYLGLRGGGTLIGIIGTGIDYTKKAFQYEDGTSKIVYLWDQTMKGKNPEGFISGSEYTNEQINQALKTDTPYDIVPSNDTVRAWHIFSIGSSIA